MASVNKVILIGNLGRDPETRYTTGGDAVTNLNIATSEQWKDKSGEKQERTEWHRVVLFGRQAEIAPAPCTVRPAIVHQMSGAHAAMKLPQAKMMSPITITGFLPQRSDAHPNGTWRIAWVSP